MVQQAQANSERVLQTFDNVEVLRGTVQIEIRDFSDGNKGACTTISSILLSEAWPQLIVKCGECICINVSHGTERPGKGIVVTTRDKSGKEQRICFSKRVCCAQDYYIPKKKVSFIQISRIEDGQ